MKALPPTAGRTATWLESNLEGKNLPAAGNSYRLMTFRGTARSYMWFAGFRWDSVWRSIRWRNRSSSCFDLNARLGMTR